MITAIILAGGNSLRFGGEIPKQFTQIAGRSLLDFSVSTFNATPSIDKIIIVVPIKFKNEIKDKYPEHEIISGGKTRRESSFNVFFIFWVCRCSIHSFCKGVFYSSFIAAIYNSI